MPRPSTRSPAAGGSLIALGAMAGAVFGLFASQPTRGFLIGTALGCGIAIAIWLVDRRR